MTRLMVPEEKPEAVSAILEGGDSYSVTNTPFDDDSVFLIFERTAALLLTQEELGELIESLKTFHRGSAGKLTRVA